MIRKLVNSIFKKGGHAKASSFCILALCLCAGIYFKFFSKTIDSPVEQVAESVLESYGIDVDFSEDRKGSGDE